jgi:hypothetical protein
MKGRAPDPPADQLRFADGDIDIDRVCRDIAK